MHHGMNQYLNLLASSSENRNNAGYVHSIVNKALSDPCVFIGFDELKMVVEKLFSVINSTSSTSSSSIRETNQILLNTLDLFSYGTFQDYNRNHASESDHADTTTSKYMTLNDAQITKLKALSILSAVNDYCEEFCQSNNSVKSTQMKEWNDSSTFPQTHYSNRRRNSRRGGGGGGTNVHSTSYTGSTCRIIPYSHLQKVISSSSSSTSSALHENTLHHKTYLRELEDLLIHCIDSNLLPHGTKLDQKHMCLEINLLPSSTPSSTTHSKHYILSRDVPIDTIPHLMDEMRAFLKRGIEAKVELEQCVQTVHHHACVEEKKWMRFVHAVNVNSSLVSTGATTSSSMVYCEEEEEEEEEDNVHRNEDKSHVKDSEMGAMTKSTGWDDDSMGSMRQGKRSKGGSQ
jgi:hypothetical protein